VGVFLSEHNVYIGVCVCSNSTMPFNKEELNTILKFGAEELFKEVDDEDEVQVGKRMSLENVIRR